MTSDRPQPFGRKGTSVAKRYDKWLAENGAKSTNAHFATKYAILGAFSQQSDS